MAKKSPHVNASGRLQDLFITMREPAMFKTYFKTATRNLSKNTLFTTLNVLGLALLPSNVSLVKPGSACKDIAAYEAQHLVITNNQQIAYMNRNVLAVAQNQIEETLRGRKHGYIYIQQ